MAPQATGTINTEDLADGTRAFHLRFPYNGERPRVILHERALCDCGCGGGWDETGARTELGNILARVRLGLWTPPTSVKESVGVPVEVPLFAPYARDWLQAKIDGALGDHPISENTASDYRWRLGVHVLPYFGRYRLDEIDRRLCKEFKAYKMREAGELREALAAGADLRDRHGRKLKPLGPASMRKVIDALAIILDEAVEDEHMEANPARGKRMRVRVPKPKRTFLEMDELACVLDCASAQDKLVPADYDAEGDTNSPAQAMVAHCLMRGLEGASAIAADLGLAKSTVSYHLRRMGVTVGRGYIERRVICDLLGRGGMRVGELCELRIGQVRVHDPEGARLRITDSKTETGIREVQMSPDLVEAVIDHLDRMRRAGRSIGPDDFLVQNVKGGMLSRQRVAQILGQAAAAANDQLLARGLPPLPHVTPHTMRRTYISIALLANNFDVKWVMSQVGRADSKMTMDVYAQLEQRAKRDHGAKFDTLIRRARHDFGTEEVPAASTPRALAVVA
jgi:DNA-binding transcriptional ArsR family regulator